MRQLITATDITFDEALINPRFSMIRSRSEVSLDHEFLEIKGSLPIMNANMDTIASPTMMKTMRDSGGFGVLHRFSTIEENIKQYQESPLVTMISLGVGAQEITRAEALRDESAGWFVLDVAHGAAIHVVEQYDTLRKVLGKEAKIIVGNFANAKSIEDFNYHCKSSQKMDAAKVGIGGGSMCTTRIVTGCGRSTLSSVLDCSRLDTHIIADGGFRTSGDIAKALAAGASTVMIGGMLAGTDETPGEKVFERRLTEGHPVREIDVLVGKRYRGSASKESYEVQGKVADHRTAEGESTVVRYKGSAVDILQGIKAGLLSSLSYVGAKNLGEFREFAELHQVSPVVQNESKAHGKS